MKIAISQISCTVAGFTENSQKIIECCQKAHSQGADLVVFPELVVSGYLSQDLLLYPHYLEEEERFLGKIVEEIPAELGLVIGHLAPNPGKLGKPLFNVLSLFQGGKKLFTQVKTLLPTYDVFDEQRYFSPADSWDIFEFKGVKLGFLICEDIWFEKYGYRGSNVPCDPIDQLMERGAELFLVSVASPYYPFKLERRRDLMRRTQKPYIYVNQSGLNDNIIFDGNSFACNAHNHMLWQAKPFEEDFGIIDTEDLFNTKKQGSDREEHVPNYGIYLPDEAHIEIVQALSSGIRDYCLKTGFRDAHLGLSGGIDSALVAYLAVQALGKEHVRCFSMPSPYSSEGSINDARKLSHNLGIQLDILPIEPIFDQFNSSLSSTFAGKQADTTEENLQARIRGTLMMSVSNKFKSLLLTTGNKSEIAMGYCTLYGDTCGGLSPIGDLWKTQIFAMCRAINKHTAWEIIPEEIITKAPSAELRPGQKDEDSLPPYHILDQILEQYLLFHRNAKEISKLSGNDLELVRSVIRQVDHQEYKRVQGAPILKISPLSFGSGRRVPINHSSYLL